MGEAKAQEITTEAAGVGTRMHKYLEDYIDTGDWPSPGSNPYAQQAHKMANEIKSKALNNVDEIWGSEVNLYMPSMYAGTTDLVGQFKGNACIMDFKQTNKPKKEEWVVDYAIISEGSSLVVSSGKRYLSLKPNDLQNYIGERGRRGHKLPRGFQRVDALSAE